MLPEILLKFLFKKSKQFEGPKVHWILIEICFGVVLDPISEYLLTNQGDPLLEPSCLFYYIILSQFLHL